MGIVKVIWRCGGDDMTADLFTKNLPEPLFEKHTSEYVGKDKYYNTKVQKKQVAKRVTSLVSREVLNEVTMSMEINLIGVDSEYY